MNTYFHKSRFLFFAFDYFRMKKSGSYDPRIRPILSLENLNKSDVPDTPKNSPIGNETAKRIALNKECDLPNTMSKKPRTEPETESFYRYESIDDYEIARQDILQKLDNETFEEKRKITIEKLDEIKQLIELAAKEMETIQYDLATYNKKDDTLLKTINKDQDMMMYLTCVAQRICEVQRDVKKAVKKK